MCFFYILTLEISFHWLVWNESKHTDGPMDITGYYLKKKYKF